MIFYVKNFKKLFFRAIHAKLSSGSKVLYKTLNGPKTISFCKFFHFFSTGLHFLLFRHGSCPIFGVIKIQKVTTRREKKLNFEVI
jgi:hypothetical protein